MLTFTNTPVTYEQFRAAGMRHLEADALVQGTFGREHADNAIGFKGCHIGCLLHDFTPRYHTHAEFEKLFGIPRLTAHLSDTIHENLPSDKTAEFFEGMVNAFQEGQDLSFVWSQFVLWLLTRLKPESGFKRVVAQTITVYEQWLLCDEPDSDTAYALETAYAAADAAAYAAVRMAVRDAHPQFWLEAANKLIELVQNAPVGD